eukprot:TRINITY_DN7119_c0_g1_i1.p1 TRINITY_DN7119_c0_g1~~TRINITY_DN7119_c0_g1_i1.p1  ORF type:complete len:404 (+),score=77.50 TRINITY_DN7119_c0_g1_i1:435-1646(+)
MTLPNRPGYCVDDSKHHIQSSTHSNQSHPHASHPTDTKNFSTTLVDHPLQQAPPYPTTSQNNGGSFPYIGGSPDKNHDVKYSQSLVLHDSLPLHPSIHGHNIHDMSSQLSNRVEYNRSFVESLAPEEIQDRKNFVKNHHLLRPVMDMVEQCKKDGILPPVPQNTYQPPTGITDFSLTDFLEAQGIEVPEEDDVDPSTDEFGYKLQQLRNAYGEELEKLNRVCSEFVARTAGLLREQNQVRAVSDQELQSKTAVIQQRFDYVRNQLRTNVCNAITVLQKQFHHQTKKRRRSLSKRATEILSHWFFDHINDPYPSDEEKAMLAAQCVLSLNQVNNWFGNKRIRYKRKCLEEEARRAKLIAQQTSGGIMNPKLLLDGDGDLGDESPEDSPERSPPPRANSKRRHDD